MRTTRWIWGAALAGSLVLAASGAVAQTAAKAAATGGDPVRGKSQFAKCAACHTVTAGPGRLGPHLAGIIGRKAAAVPGFRYSPAMQKSGLTWTRENLDRYLAAPAKALPGTYMAFVGMPNAKDRADVIAYMATAKAP
jgi:cytochrome c